MNPNNLNIRGNDAPPPYSETDIYSVTSRSHSRPNSQSPHSPHPPTSHLSPNDDAASRISSSTATGDVIFTPPETPRTTTAPNPLPDIPPSPSAALYFDGRPASVSPLSEPLVHTVAVRANSSADDMPYQSQLRTRGVTEQDWATFVNFLMPNHDAARNEAILGKKGATEGSVSEKSEQREIGNPEDVALRRRQAEATVQQWNDGFFGPRGIRVQLDLEAEPRMLGGWDSTFDERQASNAQAGPSAPREAAGLSAPQCGGWGNRNIGGFTFGNDSIRYGDGFVVDSSGVRIGNLVVDTNGIRMDHGRNRTHPVGPMPRGGPQFGGHDHHHHHHPQPPPPPPPHTPPHHHQGPPFGGPPAPHNPLGGPSGSGDRGRVAQHEQGSRSRDSSTSSSSSSNSSTSSSSIGSLPSYDEVKDQQLPLYISRLECWTADPQKMRTKAEVKQLKADLKASKSGTLQDGVDKAALRAQIKVLTQQWRQLKRQQKKTRRDRRRAKHQRRRAEKKERRQQKKEMKRAQKDLRKGRNVSPPWGLGPQIQVPPINVPPVHVPPVNVPQFNVPPINVPPINVPPVHVPPVELPAFHPPPPVGGPSCGWGRGGRGRGGPGDRGFFGANGPFGRNGAFGGENGPLRPWSFFGADRPFGPRGAVGGIGRSRGFDGGPGDYGGQGFGRGFGRGFGGSAVPDHYPGSWPDEQWGVDAPQTGVTQDTAPPTPGSVSAAKYQVVVDLETEIMSKSEAMSAVPDGERRAAEKEIEALVEKMENVRLEADEAYARELATREHQ